MFASAGRVLVLAFAVLVGLVPRTVGAQASGGANAAVRSELLERAQSADQAGDHHAALDLATRAGQLEMSTSLRMFIAEQQEHLDDVVGALSNAVLCVREAERDTGLRNREAILSTCRELRNRLDARVGRVVVHVVRGGAGSTVNVGNDVLAPPLYDVPYIVAPGRVSVRQTSDGHVIAARHVDVAAGATVRVELVPAANATASTTAPTSTRAPIVPWIVAGGGVLVVVAGAVVGGLALGAQSSLSSHGCTANAPCDPSQAGTVDTLRTESLASDVLIGAGIVVTAVGVVWGLVSRPHESAAHARVQPRGLGVSLTF